MTVEVRQAQPPALYDLPHHQSAGPLMAIAAFFRRLLARDFFSIQGKRLDVVMCPWGMSSTFLVGEHGRSPFSCDGYVLCARHLT